MTFETAFFMGETHCIFKKSLNMLVNTEGVVWKFRISGMCRNQKSEIINPKYTEGGMSAAIKLN